MRSDEIYLREMLDAADQLLALRSNPQAERLLYEDRVFRHSVFFEFVVIGEQVSVISGTCRPDIQRFLGGVLLHFVTESRTATSDSACPSSGTSGTSRFQSYEERLSRFSPTNFPIGLTARRFEVRIST